MKLWTRFVPTALRRPSPVTLLALLLGSTALSTPASAHVMPLTQRQIAAGSSHVVVGVVEDARTRWNEQRTLLFTDYSVRVEDSLRGNAPERITLSMPGGTLDGQTHGTCLSFPLESGSRYLLFLQDLDQRLLVPVTGGWQGAFQEVRGARGQSLAARIGEGEGQTNFARLVRSTRELLDQIDAAPRMADTAWMRSVENQDLPAQPYVPVAARDLDSAEETGPRQVTAGANPQFFVEHPVVAPLAFDPLPPGSPFSPADREMITYWNLYLRRPLFLINPRPTEGWAYRDGISDIAGFPSSETMEAQFGVDWFPGSYSAVLYVYDEAGHTVEVDIAMNPESHWVVGHNEPDIFGFNPDTTFSFKSVLLQHLATAWGYMGTIPPGDDETIDPVERTVDSIANHGPFVLPVLMAADAAAVRATYGGKSLHDGLISPYTIYVSPEGYPTWSFSLPTTSTAAVGATLSFPNPVKIENPGTAKLTRPTIEVYLAPQRGSLKGSLLLKRLRLRNDVRPGEVRRVELGSMKIPPKTPTGDYHIVFVLRDRDAYAPNNQAWSHPDFLFQVTR